MTRERCGSIFIFLFLLLFDCGVSEMSPPSGPFRTSIVSIKACSKPSKPCLKDPPVIFHAVIYNNTLGGNITLFRDTRNMKIRLKSFIMYNGKWKQVYLLNNLDCHGIVLHVICIAMNIKYDRKNCMNFKVLTPELFIKTKIGKGSYSFENLDVNQLLHVWVSTAIYGRVLWRSETYTQGGTFHCKEFETISEPA